MSTSYKTEVEAIERAKECGDDMCVIESSVGTDTVRYYVELNDGGAFLRTGERVVYPYRTKRA